MKRRILTFLIFAALLVSNAFLLFSCKEEEPGASAPSVPERTGEGSNIIENELFGKSPSELFELFSEALGEGANLAESLSSYKLSAALSGKRRLSFSSGVLAYTENGELKLAATAGKDSGIRLVSLNADSTDYVLNENVAATNIAAFKWFPKIKAALAFAEEHFSLPSISEDSVQRTEDGIYYLTEEYLSGLVTAAFSAYRCSELGVLPSELSEEELSEIEASAQEFLVKTELQVGFGLKMKRVRSVKLTFSLDGVSEYTDGRLDSAEADISIVLDSRGEHLESAFGVISERTDSGMIGADLSFNLSTIFNTGGTLVHIDSGIEARLIGTKIGDGGTEEEPADVMGEREVKLKIRFSPYSKTESISFDLSDVSYEEGKDGSTYANRSYSLRAGAFSSGEPTSLSASYTVDGVKITLGGEATAGASAAETELPDRVKELLKIN